MGYFGFAEGKYETHQPNFQKMEDFLLTLVEKSVPAPDLPVYHRGAYATVGFFPSFWTIPPHFPSELFLLPKRQVGKLNGR